MSIELLIQFRHKHIKFFHYLSNMSMGSLVNYIDSSLYFIYLLIMIINFFRLWSIFILKFLLLLNNLSIKQNNYITISLLSIITCSLSSFCKILVTSIFSSLNILIISSFILLGCNLSESDF